MGESEAFEMYKKILESPDRFLGSHCFVFWGRALVDFLELALGTGVLPAMGNKKSSFSLGL